MCLAAVRHFRTAYVGTQPLPFISRNGDIWTRLVGTRWFSMSRLQTKSGARPPSRSAIGRHFVSCFRATRPMTAFARTFWSPSNPSPEVRSHHFKRSRLFRRSGTGQDGRGKGGGAQRIFSGIGAAGYHDLGYLLAPFFEGLAAPSGNEEPTTVWHEGIHRG